jgi:hypothetical protein
LGRGEAGLLDRNREGEIEYGFRGNCRDVV